MGGSSLSLSLSLSLLHLFWTFGRGCEAGTHFVKKYGCTRQVLYQRVVVLESVCSRSVRRGVPRLQVRGVLSPQMCQRNVLAENDATAEMPRLRNAALVQRVFSASTNSAAPADPEWAVGSRTSDPQTDLPPSCWPFSKLSFDARIVENFCVLEKLRVQNELAGTYCTFFRHQCVNYKLFQGWSWGPKPQTWIFMIKAWQGRHNPLET